ncbi:MULTISPECIES: 3-dehydroquinate synthase [Acidianus]|uniref:3-dehydroquinate synthase n=1 Tax=Candidatus Acidianus copahuensis TaxID=1160895 RepID=A0A031LPN4_9CREN|nr:MULTISPECIES: 3-dehydroquinate synthase [Acidianus]EZQ06961.1 3-dehydroquinate synthase [Candidatus Acidianus copahuensis]NON62345.1 3-dehydroquinate synthase [Acidianus sp. RZ1]
MRNLSENICCSSVNVIIGERIEDFLSSIHGKKIAVIYSKNLRLNPKADLVLPVEDGEETKDINNVLVLVKKLFEAGFDRGDYVIAVGGGTVLDMVGFASSIYMRGLNLVNVPTTLLGMVDAGIGGKNGVNFSGIKNVLGTFYQPSTILADLGFLETLPKEEIRKGLAEVIKYGIVLDKELYDYLSIHENEILSKEPVAMEEIIYKSIKDKLTIVKQDERETKGIRIVLNFGHTVGHAIEAGSGFKIPHGHAISVGMVCESKIAEEMGYSEEGVVEDTIWLLQLYGLPLSVDRLGFPVSKEIAISSIQHDKKIRGSKVMMPFPTRIGEWKAVDVPLDTLMGFVSQCL